MFKDKKPPLFIEIVRIINGGNFFFPVAGIVSVAVASTLLLGVLDIGVIDSLEVIIPLIATLTAAIPMLVRFLYYDKEKKHDDIETVVSKHRFWENELNIQESIKEAIKKNPEVLDVEDAIYQKVLSNLEVSIVNKLDKRFNDSIKKEFISTAIIEELNPLIKNVEKYLDRIQRNSIVNLVIGIVATALAISVLAFAVLAKTSVTDIQSFFIHFLPRFTFAIFIQLFAFFFLRLYKKNLEDGKYFQNELTNLTAKSSALKISYLLGSSERTLEIIRDLSAIERNFKLLKDETTIDIEKAKLENDVDKSILGQFKLLLNKIDSKNG